MGRLRMIALAGLCFFSTGSAVAKPPMAPEDVVRGFLSEVRSGHRPEAAADYFAPEVAAHQLTAERETVVVRTPAQYADHVREFLTAFGDFRLDVEQVIARGDLVFVRWRQEGRHLKSLFGEPPTGGKLVEISSVVYRIEAGRIVEYWLQSDRKGLEIQLERLTAKASAE